MVSKTVLLHIFLIIRAVHVIRAQDYDGDTRPPPAPPPEQSNCNGIFLSYNFISRTREYPHITNVSAQPWAFRSMATILNAGMTELQNWKFFIGFQNQEILVSASNAVAVDGTEFPAPVGNGTTLAGYPQTNLRTSIDTAGDMTQIEVQIELLGTQFGVRPPGNPMPRTIRLDNDGYRCPAARRRATTMTVCCVRDRNARVRNTTTRYFPRQKGDLLISYDVLQAYTDNYLVQVTMDNANPLGRLDHWNLTWEWMRGEYISRMRGAYSRKKDFTDCIYGPAAQANTNLDFANLMTCERRPIIGDLPAERERDEQVGNLPHCCRNGTLLPTIMNETKSVSVFQMEVHKIPPDLNRTAISPPENWRIVGVLNPRYRCGPPIRVDDAQFPDPSGLQSTTTAIASWQVVCNITRPRRRESRCCVSYSAYYNDSVIPCDTCACGCGDSRNCSTSARAMLLPPEALLVPFENRTAKALSWAKIQSFVVPRPLPCADNCGVSVNWHVSSNHGSGWTARITLFNWGDVDFEEWFVAVQFNKTGKGFQRAYSFNGTVLENLNDTVFLTGLPGLNYLIREVNGTRPDRDPRVPGKQQTVLSFTKRNIRGIDIVGGDGFPMRLFFNGEECALPTRIPTADARRHFVDFGLVVVMVCLNLWLTT